MQRLRRVIVGVLNFYHQYLSPLLPRACRFTPTCSEYAAQAIQRKGLKKGGIMAVKRLCKCHPFHNGGHDPVE